MKKIEKENNENFLVVEFARKYLKNGTAMNRCAKPPDTSKLIRQTHR